MNKAHSSVQLAIALLGLAIAPLVLTSQEAPSLGHAKELAIKELPPKTPPGSR
jgi:hypothetical protein